MSKKIKDLKVSELASICANNECEHCKHFDTILCTLFRVSYNIMNDQIIKEMELEEQ